MYVNNKVNMTKIENTYISPAFWPTRWPDDTVVEVDRVTNHSLHMVLITAVFVDGNVVLRRGQNDSFLSI